jgi:TIR domain
MQAKPNQIIKIFSSYAHEDQALRDELEKHLRPLKRQRQISEWHDQAIQAGTHRVEEIDTHLKTSDIILLLISPDFFASEYCWSVGMQQALERHRSGQARIIPIILRPIDWRPTPIGELQALPRGGKPITSCPNRDEALEEVAKEIRDVVTTLLVEREDPQTIYMQATSTSPVLSDWLDRQTSQQWSERSRYFFFEPGAYHLSLQGHNCYRVDLAQETDFSNFAFQVEMTILKGSGGGLIFRAGQAEPNGYRFFVGREYFDCVYGNTTLARSVTFKAELNRIYLLTAIARSNSILLYVNKKCIATIVDRSASSGSVGLMVVNFTEHTQALVMYHNAQVWNLTDGYQ